MDDSFEFDPSRTVLGTVFSRAGEEQLSLTVEERLKHMLVIGKTGMGKTTLLKNIAIQDIHAGRGVGIIDPHGDLSRELLDEIPRWRARDLIYIDPSDDERVVTCNILADVPPDRIAATTASIVAAFKAIWRDSWGPRMERILYCAIAALIEAPNNSLVGLPRLLKDDLFRNKVLSRVADPIVRSFFLDEYTSWDDHFRTGAIDPVLNKVEALLASPIVRAMLGATTSSIQFKSIMDQRKVLIANLGKGALGPGHAQLLGAILVSGFSHAAMARGAYDARTVHREPYFLIVDEFQNFTTDTFGEIASEARKWKLGLVLGHQYLGQLPNSLRDAVLGNAATIVSFQLSGADSEIIGAEIGLKRADMLAQLSPHEVWMKHATYGGPHSPRLLPPITTNAKGREAALKQNRLRHTFPRRRVEEKISRFLTNHKDINSRPA